MGSEEPGGQQQEAGVPAGTGRSWEGTWVAGQWGRKQDIQGLVIK